MRNSSPIWHPFTQHAIAPDPVHIDRAAGAYLFARDEKHKEPRRIIDAISSWWVITHGHCHPEIVKAVQNQAAALEQVIFAGFTHDPAEDLAQRLIDITGDGLDHVFYSDSGSTAVEVALKMAIGYWEHSGRPRQKIIALEGGYHGDTFGTMSAGARSLYNKLYEPFLFDVEHIPVPVAGHEAESFEKLEDILTRNKDDVAAFIFEPLVLGAAGMQVYSANALKTLVDMCRAHDILLIADEVMTGFGRTGSMFACEQASFAPDLLCLSKGLTGGFLPMGATLCSSDIYQAFYHKDKAKTFFHSSSFSGNPLACAAANASFGIWESEPVTERIEGIAQSHAVAAAEFAARDDIAMVRQKGSILALDVKVAREDGYLSDVQPKIYNYSLSQNVLLRPIGNIIYVLPPYCSSEDDLNEIYTAIHGALDMIADTN